MAPAISSKHPGVLDVFQSGDDIAAPGRHRVAGRGGNQADAPALPEPDQAGLQVTLGAFENIPGEIAGDHRQNRLGLGIAEAAVVFEHLRSGRGEHEPEVEKAAVGEAVLLQAFHRGANEVPFDHFTEVLTFRFKHFQGTDRAHAAGIRPLVRVVDPLVITGRREDLELIVGDRGEDRDLRAFEKFFDQQPALAEFPLDQHLVEEGFGGRFIGANRHAFPGGETIELQYGRVVSANGLAGGVDVVDGGIAAGRDRMAHHEFLGELLAGLQLGRFLRGAPAGNAGVGAAVGETIAGDEITFLAGHAQIDGLRLHEGHQRREIRRRDRLRDLVNRIASRKAEDFGFGGGLVKSRDDRVFASAFSDDEDFHSTRI